MAKLLTKQNLRKIYRMLALLPPFNEWKLPAANRVTFEVVSNTEAFGWFINDPPRIQIDRSCDDWNKITHTMMHEMIHCFLWYSGHNDFDAHEAKFKKYAKIVCHIHNLNEDEF